MAQEGILLLNTKSPGQHSRMNSEDSPEDLAILKNGWLNLLIFQHGCSKNEAWTRISLVRQNQTPLLKSLLLVVSRASFSSSGGCYPFYLVHKFLYYNIVFSFKWTMFIITKTSSSHIHNGFLGCIHKRVPVPLANKKSLKMFFAFVAPLFIV